MSYNLQESLAGYLVVRKHLRDLDEKGDLCKAFKACNQDMLEVVDDRIDNIRIELFEKENKAKIQTIALWLRNHQTASYQSMYVTNSEGTYDVITVYHDGCCDTEVTGNLKIPNVKSFEHYLQLAENEANGV